MINDTFLEVQKHLVFMLNQFSSRSILFTTVLSAKEFLTKLIWEQIEHS